MGLRLRIYSNITEYQPYLKVLASSVQHGVTIENGIPMATF
jgi:hypothetical protein